MQASRPRTSSSVDHGAWITTSSTTALGRGRRERLPAAKAGIKDNDVITAVEGTAVDATHPLVELLAATTRAPR